MTSDARERLVRAKARAVADKYLPDPKAEAGTGPWAAWCIERIDELEKQLAVAQSALDQALKAPPPKKVATKKLTGKQVRFCHEYIVDLNATQAAIRAGHSESTARAIGYENLQKPHIIAFIDVLVKERNARTGWDPDRVLQRLGSERDADVAELYDDGGALKPIKDWPLVFRTGLVAGIETNELWEGAGADRRLVGYVKKVKFEQRTKITELIGRHTNVGAWKDRVEHEITPPLQQLYQQLVGTGIRPIPADPATGLGQPPTIPNAIRPQSAAPSEES